MRKNSVDTSAVLNYIKASKVPVKKRDIIAGTGYDGDFRYCITKLLKEHEELQRIGSTGAEVSYVWKPGKAIYSEMKNPEGYSDSTAGKAIANIMRTSNNGKYPMRQRFGDVWSSSNDVLDDQEGFLIITAKGGVIVACNVYPTKKPFMKDGLYFKWTDNNGFHYASVINVVNITERKLSRKAYEIGTAEKAAFAKAVADVLDIQIEQEEKVVVKEIEKKVEVPVEVTKEVEKIVEVPVEKEVYRTDPKEIELAVLRAKCEVYEKLIFRDGGNHEDAVFY